ncbi:MAG: Ig-like domain-containing protein, partial [Clostridia bacterium]|nr:Ig-like domain-containing protein [Deltaproteobacteria bacterium]
MRTLVAALVFGSLSCTPPRATTVVPTPVDDGHEVKINPGTLNLDRNAASGIVLDVHAEADSTDPSAIVKYVPPSTTPLSAKDSDKLFGRLPKLELDAILQTTFAMREKTLAPPKAGVTEQLPFPPLEASTNGPPKVEVEPLTVLRYSPMTDNDLTPELSVTFSQPMVAIGTVDQVASVVPVKLKPNAPGNWQWKGAQTLVFASAERLPMATRYEAEVPAGTKSVHGGVLAKAVKWHFSTPAPKIIAHYPAGVIATRTPVILVGFDQRVNADAIVAALSLTVGNKTAGNKKIAFRKATDAEIAADPTAIQYVQPALADRYVAIVANDPLPLASTMQLTLAKRAPSAEGPLTTSAEQHFTFQTYGPFAFVEGVCSDKPCKPTSYVSLTFSNAIDLASFEGRVHINPESPGLAAVISGYRIQLDGHKRANTRYNVRVEAGGKDIHGQTLVNEVSYTFETGNADPQFALSREFFQTQSPAVPSVEVWAVGQASVKVDVYKVTPKDWVAYRAFAQSIQQYGSEEETRPAPGKKLRSSKLDVKSPDQMTSTPIDL